MKCEVCGRDSKGIYCQECQKTESDLPYHGNVGFPPMKEKHISRIEKDLNSRRNKMKQSLKNMIERFTKKELAEKVHTDILYDLTLFERDDFEHISDVLSTWAEFYGALQEADEKNLFREE